MQTYGLLVIGSGPAGVNAAKAYVKAGGPGPVAVVSADVDTPYQRPPLSKDVLAGESEPEPQPIGKPLPDEVELLLGARVTGMDVDAREVRLGDETLGYQRLVVATGARPAAFPGAEAVAEVHYLRSLDDARRLDAAARRSRTAVVIGSGFIGCEAAASLARRGVVTTLVTPEEGPQQERLGAHAAGQIAGWLGDLGVEVRAGVEVTGVAAPRTVHLSDGTTLSPDLVLAAVSIEAGADLLEGTGVQLHEGRIVVDESLSAGVVGTSGEARIWAAGDSARAHNASARRALTVEHWGDALRMGTVAGTNAAADAGAGESVVWDAVPGFWTEIGEHTLKHAAWGDGHETEEVVERTGGFTVWYGDGSGRLVGVLTYNADDDYERGEKLIQAGASVAQAVRGDKAPEPPEEESAQA